MNKCCYCKKTNEKCAINEKQYEYETNKWIDKLKIRRMHNKHNQYVTHVHDVWIVGQSEIALVHNTIETFVHVPTIALEDRSKLDSKLE